VVAVRAGPLVAELTESLTALGATRDDRLSGAILVLPRVALLEAARTARDLGFDLLLDVFGIDWSAYPGHHGARFSVTYHMHAIKANERCSLRVHLDDRDTLPTVTGVWPAASFMEREVYDLFGVTFDGHPDLRKLVTPEDLEGHPLRKDFPLGETPTLFNDGRFIDPASFRAGMIGKSRGHTGWVGGARRGVVSATIVQETIDEKGGEA
jgi:NADH-quinone oxidoreductase subunit C